MYRYILSFAWIVSDVLSRIKRDKWNKNVDLPSHEERLAASIISYSKHCQVEFRQFVTQLIMFRYIWSLTYWNETT
jgi:hypothetical protein